MLKTIAMATAATILVASTATAATTSYKATSAQSATSASDNHSLWSSLSIPGLGNNFHFEPAGSFTIDGDMALLTGTVYSALDNTSGWNLEFNYSKSAADMAVYGPTGPAFKNENGSAANQATVGDNIFMTMTGGMLEGFGTLENVDFTTSVMPTPTANPNNYAVQLGTYSNNKNSAYGLANWFFFNATEDCGSALCDQLNGRQGDINIDLAPVPLPAPALMLLAGLGSLAGARRMKRS